MKQVVGPLHGQPSLYKDTPTVLPELPLQEIKPVTFLHPLCTSEGVPAHSCTVLIQTWHTASCKQNVAERNIWSVNVSEWAYSGEILSGVWDSACALQYPHVTQV